MKFCEDCGSKLRVTLHDEYTKYNPKTGKKYRYIVQRLKCPKASFFAWLFFNHSHPYWDGDNVIRILKKEV